MTLLHFSGKFKFQPPIYNNEPGSPERYFDGSITPREVHEKITSGVEPLKYFEFEFSDVFIHKITYSDGTCATNDNDDPIVGKKILLKGLLVDTSPHLERGRLFAGEFRVLDVFMGKVELAVQSDLFKIIKNKKGKVNKYSADFESNLYDLTNLENEFVSSNNSRFLRELGGQSLKIYYHVSHFDFDFSSLKGDVFGYIGLQNPELNSNNIRISKRRVLITPNIDLELKKDLGLEKFHKESNDVVRNDMEGTYEILEKNRLILFRYLNSIPFIDPEYSIPKGYHFFIVLYYNNTKADLGLNAEIDLDPHSISNSGGVHVIQIPIDVKIVGELSIEVKCKKNRGIEKTYMKEPKFDIVLHNHPNYIVLSSNENTELAFNIFEKNKKMKKFDGVELLVGYHENLRSPLVAWPVGKAYPKEEQYICNIQARNLENSGEIVDPIYGIDPESEPPQMRVKISGDLPWDRYYGNYVYVKLKVNINIVTQQNIPVRVLHAVPIEKLKDDVINLNKPVIQDVVSNLMKYYIRYFPWLHTEYVYAREKTKPKKIYQQFLKIDDLNYLTEEDVTHWHAVHESVNMINHLLERLERDERDWKKMPRSRDFPINGVEFLKLWKAALLDKFAEKLDDEKNAILASDLEEISKGEIDLTDFGELQKIVDEIDYTVKNITAENKKILLTCKLVILNNLINESKELKKETKHTHSH